MTLEDVFRAAEHNVSAKRKNDRPKAQCLWPSEFAKPSPDSAYEFVRLCQTWDEAGRQVRSFPDKEYLRLVCKEWVECRLSGRPLIIEKSRRLVTSWVLRALELYDGGQTRGNQLITHTKRDDAAGHVWRIFWLYENLRLRFPDWDLKPPMKYGNELTQTLDLLVLPNETKISQYYEQPKGLQGSGYSIVTMEEFSIYKQPAGMYDQASRLVQSPPGLPNGLIVGVTNYEFSDSYEMVIAGASPSPY